ncbi:MAG: hypothetical protein FH758_01820 [Firmicutes bacterium]|nr:hypothetical protein [Bacillota bacterium]
MKKLFPWLTFFLLVLNIFIFMPALTVNGEVVNADELEIKNVIIGAVTCNDWMQAKSPDKVKEILSKYYTGVKLTENTNSVWRFIKEPTDYYWVTSVDNCRLIYLSMDEVLVVVDIISTDITSGEEDKGKGVFTVAKTNSGWKISDESYHW